MRAWRPFQTSNASVVALACTTALAVFASTGGAASAAESQEAPAIDLLGTWFVLVHYKDSATANPDAERWEDKVWTFEEKGTRLQWTEYPIVVFDDRTGRFETLGGNTRSRSLRFWEPTLSQRKQIQDGPQVNSRGSKTKTLRGNPAKGYESFGKMRAMSASVIGYHETWSIANTATLPVFTRDDMMGTGRGTGSENLEGRTRYTATSIIDGGDTVTGTFARDKSRLGTFRMVRAGDVQGLPKDDKTPNEKAADRFVDEQIERAVGDDPEAQRKAREQIDQLRKERGRQR